MRASAPLLLLLVSALLRPAPAAGEEKPPPSAADLVPWLLANDTRLLELPFAEVVRAATGRRLLPVDPADPADAAVLAKIGLACERALAEANDPGSDARKATRINEASRFFEDRLGALLAATDGLECAPAPNALGETQRSGYPDLRLVDRATGRVWYLDPKVFAADSRGSSFRTFYYEPRTTSGKVLDDARHLVVGIAHVDSAGGRRRRFTSWELIDLSGLRVRLKAEFQAANRDVYRPGATLRSGGPGR